VFVVQVSQGSGAPPQDETSNEGLVVDVDSPATSQSKYSPFVWSCILCACMCVCVCMCMWSFIRFDISVLNAIIVRFNQCGMQSYVDVLTLSQGAQIYKNLGAISKF
jgi:hypothetical protein